MPGSFSTGSPKKIWWQGDCGHEWEAVIKSRVKGSNCPYCSGLRVILGITDLPTTKPLLAAQWHFTKNGNLTPKDFSAGSGKKVWWNCKNNHEWEATINSRSRGNDCPYCSGLKVTFGDNDLLTVEPFIASQWHPTKNGAMPATHISARSSKKVWWLGACGHELDATPSERVATRSGCPICSGHRVLEGYNDLAFHHPELVQQWHPTKNGDLLPSQITSRSGKKVWWIGTCGHEWEQKISNRTALNQNCPYCSNQKVSIGLNDFASYYPEIAKEWHPTKNGELTPQQVSKQSGQKAWWLGKCGHEWETVIAWRKTNGCAICANLVIVAGINDFLTHHPEIAVQWHPTKNLPRTACSVPSGSDFSAWWICKKGHEWQTTVSSRTGKGKTGCPACWASTFVSKAEQEIYDYVTSLGVQAEQSNRRILGKKQEIDIYIPSKKIAIEFNGLYWHSEKAGKDKDYHRNKWLACKDQGIQLIQVWEDEWKRNPEQIKRMLAHKLGVSNERKVFARKTVVVPISKAEVEKFLNENHVQG